MYLEICGPITKINEAYRAEFQPGLYNVNPRKQTVPLFITLEALAQIGCRSCSEELFNRQSTFPIQFSNLSYHTPEYTVPYHTDLLLSAEVTQKGAMGVAKCALLTRQEELLITMDVWVALRVINRSS